MTYQLIDTLRERVIKEYLTKEEADKALNNTNILDNPYVELKAVGEPEKKVSEPKKKVSKKVSTNAEENS